MGCCDESLLLPIDSYCFRCRCQFPGDGLRCAGLNVIRLETVVPDTNGDAATSVDIASMGSVGVGETKYYQYWYRDPLSSTCGALFNLTNGYQVTWTP